MSLIVIQPSLQEARHWHSSRFDVSVNQSFHWLLSYQRRCLPIMLYCYHIACYDSVSFLFNQTNAHLVRQEDFSEPFGRRFFCRIRTRSRPLAALLASLTADNAESFFDLHRCDGVVMYETTYLLLRHQTGYMYPPWNKMESTNLLV